MFVEKDSRKPCSHCQGKAHLEQVSKLSDRAFLCTNESPFAKLTLWKNCAITFRLWERF